MNTNNNHYITIMAGGVGSRFWPASTEETPKQFLDILGVGKSLLRLTFERFLNLVPAERNLIVKKKKYKEITQEHLPELPESNILCEPSRNNTAPCVAYTALRLQAMNPDAIFVTAPSDHVILKEDAFLDRVREAFAYVAEQDVIVTLGIQPTRPDTGYGYIQMQENEHTQGPTKVNSFKEKPNLATAKEYLADGSYLWNAGIFVWKVNDLLKSFEKNEPKITDVLCQDISKYNTVDEQEYIDSVYPDTPRISVDYAILERADNVYTIPSDIGWSDLGTWNSLHAYLDKDDNATVTLGAKNHLIDTKNSIVRTDSDKTVVIKGLDNYIVVDEPGALLIYPKSDEQEIKQVVRDLNKI